MRTTAQILGAINSADAGESLPSLLCIDCTRAMDVNAAGMALMSKDGHQGVVGASGPLATEMEDLQFELGEGPGVDASRASRPVLDSDLSVSAVGRWPGFGPAALAAGVRAVYALPLEVGAVQLGSLCLYRSAPGSWNHLAVTTALAYADAAVAVLLHLQAQPGGDLAPELDEPLEFRSVVHQATGFLAVDADVSLAEALVLLRAHAFARGRPLFDVARDVLAGNLRIRSAPSEDG